MISTFVLYILTPYVNNINSKLNNDVVLIQHAFVYLKHSTHSWHCGINNFYTCIRTISRLDNTVGEVKFR